MQRLLGPYAQAFNRRYGRVGHLWQGRYKPILVEDGQHLIECSRYIHLNPPRAQMVSSPIDYKWSSYQNYMGGRGVVEWVETEKILRYAQGVEQYRSFVEECSPGELADPFEQASAGLVLGTEAFIEEIKKRSEVLSHKQVLPTLRALNRTQSAPSVQEVHEAVESTFNDFSACQKTRMFMFALRLFSHSGVEDIAKTVQRTPTTVSQAVRSIRRRCKDDATLANRFSAVAEKLRR